MTFFNAFQYSAVIVKPFRPDTGRREEINLILYFYKSLWCPKKFYEGLKAFIKSFGASERSVK